MHRTRHQKPIQHDFTFNRGTFMFVSLFIHFIFCYWIAIETLKTVATPSVFISSQKISWFQLTINGQLIKEAKQIITDWRRAKQIQSAAGHQQQASIIFLWVRGNTYFFSLFLLFFLSIEYMCRHSMNWAQSAHLRPICIY